MGKIYDELKQSKRFADPRQEAVIALLRTADVLRSRIETALLPHQVSPEQYNVLRILRGAGADGASCKEVGNRMVTRDPDITRLMDRLETRGLIMRDRAKEDRRVVTHKLTPDGLALVNALDEPVEAAHQKALGHMSRAKLRELIGLLEELRIDL
jgi:DNA-binding MarR family transcriptional regulator